MAEIEVGPVSLHSWARLRWPDLSDDDREARLSHFRRRIAAGRLSERFWFGAWAAGSRHPRVATHLDPMGEDRIEVRSFVGAEQASPQMLASLAGLVAHVIDALGSAATHRVERDVCTEAYANAFRAAGFRRVGERLEFRRPLTDADLAVPARHLLRWRSLEEVERHVAAATLDRVAVGDPHHDPDDDALETLDAWLSDPVLSHGPECVRLGYLAHDADPAALVVAQVSPKTGWSRLSYMGVVPERRGMGLGREVHRHGLKCLRQQGGELYHGGTAAENLAMVALFEHAGAERFRELVDWIRPKGVV